jgi:hypothetical protein
MSPKPLLALAAIVPAMNDRRMYHCTPRYHWRTPRHRLQLQQTST